MRGTIGLIAALLIASCASDDPRATTQTNPTATTESSSTEPPPSAGPTSTEPATGEWVDSVAVIEKRPAGTEPRYTEPGVFESTSSGYLLAGGAGPDFAVWRSDDLSEFELLYLDQCCERRIRPRSIAEFGDTLLVSGTGTDGQFSDTERGFLLRSDDDGQTWTSIDDVAFTTEFNRVDEVMVTDDAVIVSVVDDRGPGFVSAALWTDDLATWRPIELPDSKPNDTPWFITDGSTVFASATRSGGLDGRESSRAYWSSTDGGRTFTREENRPDRADGGGGGALVIDDQLVLTPRVMQDEWIHNDPTGVSVLRPGESWGQLPPERGTWGDGETLLLDRAADGSGRHYALVGRLYRASQHYCFADPTTCREPQLVVLASDDGREWFDTGGTLDVEMRADPALAVADDGSVAVVSFPPDTPEAVVVAKWEGAQGPVLTQPDDYGPPDIPVPLYEHPEDLAIGEVRRYLLAVGGCGSGMFVEDQRWEPDEPIGDVPPEGWPYRESEWIDGPAGHAYGQIERLADDEIEFSIEGLGPVATFHPAPPLDYEC